MPPEAVDAAIADWHARGLAWHPRCDAQRELLVVVVTDDATPEARFAYTDRGTIPTIWVAARTERSPSYIWAHELKHWLAMCSGEDSTGDADHSSVRIWPELH